MNKIKAIVLFTAFIDIIGLGVIIPIMPYYLKSFGAQDFVVTLLISVYALLAFFSAPILGALSDRYGRRPVLVASIISTSIGWFLFSGAQTIFGLFVGRGIDGLAAGNITTAQSALADIAKDEKERATNMGYMGAIFGIALVIGPVLGGFLGSFGHTVPFLFVGLLSGINGILAYFFLPETHKKDPTQKVSWNPVKPIIDGISNREMRPLFVIWFLFGVAFAIQQSIFALYSSRIFGFDAKTVGILFGVIGLVLILNQVLLMKRVWLTYFSEQKLARVMLLVFSLAMIMMSIPTMVIFMIGMVIYSMSHGNLRAVFSSFFAGQNPAKRGEYIGISMSVMSLSLVAGPLIATVTYPINPHLPFIIAAGTCLLALVMMKIYPIQHHVEQVSPQVGMH
jgi:DHA1 family tetracycline resistance protein-like MFS transporter